MIPGNLPATILTSAADVKATAAKFQANSNVNQHKEVQWCYSAISAANQKTTCKFDAASGLKFNANMYCETIEGWFYPDADMKAKAYNFTAPSNGGKPVTMTLTYGKAIDVVTDNKVVLNICGKVAEALAVPYPRVTDSYGGYYGYTSPALPGAKAATPAPPAANSPNSTAANSTLRVLNATANSSNATN